MQLSDQAHTCLNICLKCFPGAEGANFFSVQFSKHADFPGGSDDKASTYNAGDSGSIPGLGRSPGEENDNPLQYSCLENPMDRGAW